MRRVVRTDGPACSGPTVRTIAGYKGKKMMLFFFRIVFPSNRETRASFFAENEDSARKLAEIWAEDGTVYECTDRWSV